MGGLTYSRHFAALLDGSPGDRHTVNRYVPCEHRFVLQTIGSDVVAALRPDGETADGADCPQCGGTGYRIVRVFEPRHPMTLALARLRNALPMRRGFPHPAVGIKTLLGHSWQPRRAAAALGLDWEQAEPYLLQVLRMLHGRYEEAARPTYTAGSNASVSWVDMSDSQRSAIEAGEVAQATT